MTTAVSVLRAKVPNPFDRLRQRVGAGRERRARGARGGVAGVPPLSPRLQFLRAVLVSLLAFSGAFLLHAAFVSGLQQSAAQEQLYDELREQLAAGTAPIGPTDSTGEEIAIGTPVAYLEIPKIGVEHVVVEGTTAGALLDGPGHRRDTPLPGQIGTSVILGRRGLYGAPFDGLRELQVGDLITVTTGQGKFEYRVTGLRVDGAPLPPPAAAGEGRLLLMTAAGNRFLPNGLLRVDATLDGTAVGGPARLISTTALPDRERAMGTDTSTLWALVLWLQAVILVSVGFVWAWYRWGRPQAWLVFVPPLCFVALGAAGETVRLLPNLM